MAGAISKKKARIEKETVQIPEDVTVEILKRLPVKSLLRFSCACKTWYSVISDPKFCNKLHRMRACVLICESSQKFATVTIESLLMNEETAIRPTPLSFPWQPEPEPKPEPFDISSNENQLLGSCKGLICVDHKSPDRDRCGLILWNPSTRKFRRLPPTRRFLDHGYDGGSIPSLESWLGRHYWTYAWFGYDESVDDYKLVWVECRLYRPRGTELEVFTLKSNTWRSGHTPPTGIFLAGLESYCYKSIGVLSNGAIHWVTRYKDRSCSGIRILALDLASEKFRLLESPHGGRLDYNTWVGSLSGCLCLCIDYKEGEGPVYGGRGMDLWMMKEYGVGSSWIKLVSLPIKFRPDFVVLRFSPILFSNEEGNMVAMFEHVYKIMRLSCNSAADQIIMRLQIEKGAMVSSETLLCASRDRRIFTNVSVGQLCQNYAVLHMEESLVSLN